MPRAPAKGDVKQTSTHAAAARPNRAGAKPGGVKYRSRAVHATFWLLAAFCCVSTVSTVLAAEFTTGVKGTVVDQPLLLRDITNDHFRLRDARLAAHTLRWMITSADGRVVPWGDTALLELTVRRLGHHLVLVGPYSRYHWHHPGPLIFDWLVIPYHAFGTRAAALYQGALLTAAISVGSVGWIAFRRGGTRFTWCAMALVGMLIWAVGPEVVRVPWNPWITILPLLAVICLAWNAASGELWAYPFAVAGASFLVQSHVGYAAVAGAVLGVARPGEPKIRKSVFTCISSAAKRSVARKSAL